jgi:hypothetical protein
MFITVGLVVATWYQACLTRGALNETKREFNLTERPWIGVGTHVEIVQPPTVPPVTSEIPNQMILKDAPFYTVIHLKNYGRTPALHAQVIGDPHWIDLPKSLGPFFSKC